MMAELEKPIHPSDALTLARKIVDLSDQAKFFSMFMPGASVGCIANIDGVEFVVSVSVKQPEGGS